jgi:hypothetical protein
VKHPLVYKRKGKRGPAQVQAVLVKSKPASATVVRPGSELPRYLRNQVDVEESAPTNELELELEPTLSPLPAYLRTEVGYEEREGDVEAPAPEASTLPLYPRESEEASLEPDTLEPLSPEQPPALESSTSEEEAKEDASVEPAQAQADSVPREAVSEQPEPAQEEVRSEETGAQPEPQAPPPSELRAEAPARPEVPTEAPVKSAVGTKAEVEARPEESAAQEAEQEIDDTAEALADDTAEALVEGLEEAAGQQGGAPLGGVASGAGGGEVAADAAPEDGGLATWKAQASAAIGGIPEPEVADPEQVQEPLQEHAKTSAERIGKDSAGLHTNLVNARPKPPEPNPPFPPVLEKKAAKDFVPEATALVTAAASKPLPEQKVPALSESPQHHMPVIQTDETGRMTFTAMTKEAYDAVKAEEASKAGPQADQQKKKDDAQQSKLDKAKGAAKEQPAPKPPPKPGEELVLGAEAPKAAPPRKFAPGEAYARQVTLGNVAAMLLADVDSQSQAIVSSGREAAFPPRKPLLFIDEFKELGQAELVTATTQLLDKRLRTIAAEVGVTGDKLDKMIALRKQELSEKKEATSENLLAAVNEADAKIEKTGDGKKKAVADTRKAVDEDTEEKLEASRGERDPALVAMRRDRMLGKVNTDIGHATVAYDKLGKARADILSREEAVRGRAYNAAAKMDEDKLLAEAGTDEAKKKDALIRVMESREWARKKTAEISQLKVAAASAVKGLQEGLQPAGAKARELIREWAANMEGEERSWWDKLWDMLADWRSQSDAVSEAWEEERTQQTADAVMQDRAQLESLKAMVEQGVIDPKSKESLDKLNDEQKAIVQSFFNEGPDKGNAIAAVAAGMRVRLAGERVPEIAKKLEAMALETEDWRPLGKLAAAIRPGFIVQNVVSDLWKAMDQWGTDEEAVYKALSGLSPLENKIVHKAYKAIHGRDLDDHIRSEFSGTEKDRAMALASGDQAKADAAALRDAMKGGITGWGTDEKLIMSTLRNKTPEERAAIRAAYEAEYGVKLDADLKDELGGHDIEQAEAHLEGNTAKADAIAIDQAMRGGWFFGAGTDRGEIEAVYKRTRDEVMAEAARHPEWTTAEVEAEITRRNQLISKEYGDKYAKDFGVPAEKALEAAYKSDLSGAELDLVTALQKNDLVAADAARIRIETDSVFYASDSAINSVLQDQYKRGLDEAKRDKTADFIKRRDSANPPWTAEELKKQQEALKQSIDTAARENGKRNMEALGKTFDTNYKNPFEGGFDKQLEMNMSGYDRAKAVELVKQGGYLSPAQEAHYAMAGAGTDEEALKKVFDGKTKAEIEQIKKEYKEKYGKDLAEEVKDETSGRDQFDLGDLIQGKPATPEEAIERLKAKRKYEAEQMGLGNSFAKAEMARLDEEIAALEKDAEALKRGDMSAEERQFKEELFYDYSVKAAERAVEDHRSAVDSVTDTAAQIAGVVALVVAVVVLTVITGGAAGVGFAAALGTVMSSGAMMAGATAASVVASIATKALMRGPDYYASGDIVTDLAIGVVDVATAGLTANMGGKLLGEGLKAGTKLGGLARMAQSSSRATRVVAHMVAQGTEGLVQSLPSAIASNLANDKNWQGDAFGNIMSGIAMQAGIGTVVAGGMGALGGIAKPEAKSLAKMAAEERHLLIEGYQKAHPGATLAQLEEDLAGGRIAAVGKAELDAFKKELRSNLMDGVPPELRSQFSKVEIKVLSDAEFEAFTKSSSAKAVVLIEEGKPRVILREGASPSVLREEGTHLAQMVDPKTSGLVKKLDEANLANWEKMGLAEQLELYQVKIDLEIDAHRRLIANLEDSLAKADNAAAREALERELKVVNENLGNLLERADEVAAISPAQKLRISQGLEPKPQYLEQKPRLFHKQREGLEIVSGEVHIKGVEIGDSPLSKQQKGTVYQVGEHFEEDGRTYRLVVQLDEEGKVIRMREEIFNVDKKWVQRGSEGRERGIVAEAASLKQSDKAAKEAAAKGEQHIRVPTQDNSGKGFDEARVIFDADGSARIQIIEVKDYPGRYVPGDDFTAIGASLEDNLTKLRKDLSAALLEVQRGKAETALGMNKKQLKSALAALDEKRLEFEIRVGPETSLAKEGAGKVLKRLKEEIGDKLGITDLKIDAKKIDQAFMDEAFADTAKASIVGKNAKVISAPSPGVTPETIQTAEAALTSGKKAVTEEAQVVQKEAVQAQELIDRNKAVRKEVASELSMLERVEGATGVQKGADYDKAMADLKAFYAQQVEEAKHVLDVQKQRLDPIIGGGAYGINARYELTEFSHGLTNVKIKVHLDDTLLAGNASDLARLKADAIAGVDKHFNLPKNHLQNGNRLHVELEFVSNPADAHLKVDVQPGRGRATQTTWFVDSDPTVHAHELGHQMGLLDEYVDPQAVRRATQSSPGVHSDDSLMADFWQKHASGHNVFDAAGKPVASPSAALKARHLEQIGDDIEAVKLGAATRTAASGTPSPAPLATSVDPADLTKFSGLDAPTIARLEQLDAPGLQALGRLPQTDIERVAALNDTAIKRLAELGKADPEALARIAATDSATLARLTQLEEIDLLVLGQLDKAALTELGRLGPTQLQVFAGLDEASLRLLGGLARDNPTAFAKVSHLDKAGLTALSRLGDGPIGSISGLSSATIDALVRLEPASLGKFGALKPEALAKFDGLSQDALEKFGRLEPAALEKFGALRYASALEKFGDLPMEGLERLATLEKSALQKFGGWDKDIVKNIAGLDMKNIRIIASLNVAPGADAVNELLNFGGKRLNFGSDVFIIDRAGLQHIMERHHPKYWDGSVKVRQSFLDPKLTVDDMVGIIESIMRSHRDEIIEHGTRGMYQMEGEFNGVRYVLGLNKGRVGQLYPK